MNFELLEWKINYHIVCWLGTLTYNLTLRICWLNIAQLNYFINMHLTLNKPYPTILCLNEQSNFFVLSNHAEHKRVLHRTWHFHNRWYRIHGQSFDWKTTTVVSRYQKHIRFNKTSERQMFNCQSQRHVVVTGMWNIIYLNTRASLACQWKCKFMWLLSLIDRMFYSYKLGTSFLEPLYSIINVVQTKVKLKKHILRKIK